MRIYRDQNVLDAARERVSWVFDEFEDVVVAFSGGKDSTVVLHLALDEAERRGRLPLPVHFIDQEAEWQGTVDYARTVMEDPRVLPRWFQIPFRMPNSTSADHPWVTVWDPAHEDVWIHPRWPRAITQNTFGDADFYQLFNAILKEYYPDRPVCQLGGIRAEESPTRAVGMTTQATYKWATWGKVMNKSLSHFTLYPIYDWGYRDVWKAIHEHGWAYNKIYDAMYRYGYYTRDMRVSSLHHETAVSHLRFMQEMEPATWSRLTRRFGGINSVKHLQKFAITTPTVVPPMFTGWVEYRDHLLDKLILDPVVKAKFADKFAKLAEKYDGMPHPEFRHRVEIASILVVDDDCFTKLKNWENSPKVVTYRKFKKGANIPAAHMKSNPYLNGK